MPKTHAGRRRRPKSRAPARRSDISAIHRQSQVTLICVALVVLVLAAYWRAGELQFTRFDDDVYITQNDHVRDGLTLRGIEWAFTTGYASNWHPLTWISHQLDWTLFGEDAGGAHLENVLLHAANTLLLFLVLSGMTGSVWRSAFVAALFGLHPLHVESVAWVVERKDVLSTLFWMLTMLAYARYVRRPSMAGYALVALCFALGLMAKPMLVSLPIVLLMLDWWPLGRCGRHGVAPSPRPFSRCSMSEVRGPKGAPSPRPSPPGEGEGRPHPSPLLGGEGEGRPHPSPLPGGEGEGRPHPSPLLGGEGEGRPHPGPLLRGEGEGRPHPSPLLGGEGEGGALCSPLSAIIEKLPLFALATVSCVVTFVVQREGGAMRPLEVFPLGVRLANAAVAYASYAVKTIWPAGLCAFYPHPGDTLPVWKTALSAAFLAGATALAIASARKRPYITVGWFWYLVTLIPVIGIVQVGSQAMADRYTYVPLIGLFICAAWGIPELVLRPGKQERVRVLAGLGAATVLVLAVCTSIQTAYWCDTVSLFTRALRVTSRNALAHNNLGRALFDEGRKEEAFLHYTRALEIDPKYVDALYNLGGYYGDRGDEARAIDYYQRVLRLNPQHPLAHNNLGAIFYDRGQLTEAANHLRTALRVNPEYIDARYNLALALRDMGKLRESIRLFEQVLRAHPEHQLAQYNLGIALSRAGDLRGAVERYREALRLRPDYAIAHYSLGAALHQLGDLGGAAGEYEEALRLDPNIPEAHSNLGWILAKRGRVDEAIAECREALRLAPDYQAARDNLALALSMRRRSGE